MPELAGYVGNPEAFPILRSWDFYNHAGVSPLPRVAADALGAYSRQAEYNAYLNSGWYTDIEKLRQAAAGMMNCTRDEIAFVKNTSEGISIVANGVDWQWGDRIVTTAAEYPANIYPWMEVVRSRGAELIMIPEETDSAGVRRVPTDKILYEAADPRTRIVTLSHVEFASGQRHDLKPIGEYCRANKKLFCVDAIQSLGVLPVDVREMKIDYLSADGHKWLLGPEGAGLFYARKELIERTRPLMIGWMNVQDLQNFSTFDYTLKHDAGRFECGTYNVPGLLSLKMSLELLKGLGTDAVGGRIKTLTDRLIEGLVRKGYKVVSPRDRESWSGIVSFTTTKHSHSGIVNTLRKEHRIEMAVRDGRIRCSPHFYNTEAQIDRLLGLLPDH